MKKLNRKNKYKFKEIFNKIIKVFRKYFSTNILFITYVVSSLFIGFLLRLLTIGNAFTFRAFLSDFIVSLVVGSFGYLIKPKHQFKYFLTINIIFTIVCIINHIYYTFYMSFASVSLLSTLTFLADVSDSVTTKIELIYFVYLISPLLLILVNHFLTKKNYYYEVGKDEKGKFMFKETIVSSIIFLTLIIFTMTKSDGSKLVKLWNRDYVVQNFGIYSYTLTDVVQSIQPVISPMFGYDKSAKEFRDFYSVESNKKKEENKYSNIFEGKNVIFIHMESIQNFLVDLKVNGIEITPNINRLTREGLYFSKFYPQISTGTSSDTEFTLSTGLLPSNSGTVFVNYFNREYETIQQLFNNKGYYTFSMHANKREYWNRSIMYDTLGYQEFYAKDNLVVPEDTSDKDYVGLGLGDKSFFNQIIPILNDIKSNHTNYMGTIITLSNHTPFNDLEKYGDLDFSITYKKESDEVDIYGNTMYVEEVIPYLEDTEMGNYLKSAHYADEALGEFFESVIDNKLDEDTVFILYGDHESKLGKKNLNLLYNYDIESNSIKSEEDPTYISLNNYQYELLKNTPLIIWTSDSKLKGEIKDVMGMWDVLPTVSNMFNLSYNYALGNDIFSSNEKIVVFPNGDIITNKVYYNNLKDDYISVNGEPISNDYILSIKEYADKRLEVSKGIIVYDLINKERENLKKVISSEKNK